MIETNLASQYEMSQSEVGEEMFLKQQSIQKIEAKAIQNFKQALAERGLTIKDLLNE